MTEVKTARRLFLEHWEELTFIIGVATFENPFAPKDESDMEFIVREKVVGIPSTETFGVAVSGAQNELITITSSDNTSTIDIRIIVKG